MKFFRADRKMFNQGAGARAAWSRSFLPEAETTFFARSRSRLLDIGSLEPELPKNVADQQHSSIHRQ